MTEDQKKMLMEKITELEAKGERYAELRLIYKDGHWKHIQILTGGNFALATEKIEMPSVAYSQYSSSRNGDGK